MRKKLVGATVGLALGQLLLAPAWVLATSAPPAPKPAVSTAKPAAKPIARPDFRLPALDGRKLGPADYRGKVVVLDFWATWCGPCHAQAEILRKVHKQFAAAEVQFLAVDVGEDEKTVRQFVKKRSFPYPVLLDPEHAVAGKYGIVGFPTMMIVDRKGEVSYLRPGLVSEKRLRELVQQAGAKPHAAPASKPAAP